MIFGKPQELAIECFVDEISNNVCYGRLAILAKELYIGDISMSVILNTPLTFFKESLTYCGQRYYQLFNEMNSQEIWDFLYVALYNDSDSDDNNTNWKTMIDNETNYQKFSVFTNFSECFDGEIAFLVENDHEEKLIWQDFESKMIQEISLAKGTYQSVVESLIAYFTTVRSLL
jgi:hypothetical protein